MRYLMFFAAIQLSADPVRYGMGPGGGLLCHGKGVARLGLQGQGLSPKQMTLCDSFVYIAQYGAGTASLNVTVATTVVLHHFALWAGYREHARDGCKYVVAPKPLRTHSRGVPLSRPPYLLPPPSPPTCPFFATFAMCLAHTSPAHTHIAQCGLLITFYP